MHISLALESSLNLVSKHGSKCPLDLGFATRDFLKHHSNPTPL